MKNLLPKDGTVEYLGKIFTEEQSSVYYVKLMNEINWQNDIVKIFGKEIITKREAMSWHSDNEKEILENSAIASVSFGAERKFGFRHNSTKEEISLMLENGSVLIMKDEVQKFWKHKLYTSTKIKEPRINLTFRTIVIK